MMIYLKKKRENKGEEVEKRGKREKFHCTLGKKYDFEKWAGGQRYQLFW